MHHTAAAAVLDGLGEGAVRTAVALPSTDIQGFTYLTGVDDLHCLAESRGKEPVLSIVDVLTQLISGVYHILRIFNGGSQGLLTDDIATCIHSLDCYIVVQEVGHTDVHQIALALSNCLVVIVISSVAGEAVAVCQFFDAAQVPVANTDDLHLVQHTAVAVRMKIGRKCCADQQNSQFFHCDPLSLKITVVKFFLTFHICEDLLQLFHCLIGTVFKDRFALLCACLGRLAPNAVRAGSKQAAVI